MNNVKKTKGKNWRRVYKYKCTHCEKQRYTRTFIRFKSKYCTLCVVKPIDENQGSLFQDHTPNDKKVLAGFEKFVISAGGREKIKNQLN